MSVLNWCYVAERPFVNGDIVDAQIWLAHKYRNRLCELELKRRHDSDACIRELDSDYLQASDAFDAAQSRVDGGYEKLRKIRQKARKRVECPGDLKQEIDAAKNDRNKESKNRQAASRAAYAKLASLQEPYKSIADSRVDKDLNAVTRKSKVYMEYLSLLSQAGLDAGAYEYKLNSLKARAECGCYWGTYLVIEDACRDFGKGAPPKFKRFDRNGSVAAQLHGGMTVGEALSCNSSILRIEMPETTVTRGNACKGIVHLRVGSNKDRSPLWATFPVFFDRPLPDDGVIKWAYLDRTRLGSHDKYKLRLTIETSRTQPIGPVDGETVAIHLGYRKVDGGIRVATWVSSGGHDGELVIDDRNVEGFFVSSNLESVRDSRWEQIQAALVEWIKSIDMPQWLKDATGNISQWRGPERLSRLVTEWRSNRFDADMTMTSHWDAIRLWAKSRSCQDVTARSIHWSKCVERFKVPSDENTVFGLLEYWRRWDKHLAEWSVNQSRDAGVTRDQMYRRWTKEMRSKFSRVIMAKVDWAKLAEVESDTSEVTQTSNQRRQARIASPGRLQQFIKERFSGDLVTSTSRDMTSCCNSCRSKEEWNRAKQFHQCRSCGVQYDQDINAAKNTLARGLVMLRESIDKESDSQLSKDSVRKPRKNRKKIQDEK